MILKTYSVLTSSIDLRKEHFPIVREILFHASSVTFWALAKIIIWMEQNWNFGNSIRIDANRVNLAMNGPRSPNSTGLSTLIIIWSDYIICESNYRRTTRLRPLMPLILLHTLLRERRYELSHKLFFVNPFIGIRAIIILMIKFEKVNIFDAMRVFDILKKLWCCWSCCR